jgi:hypothetical protein
MKLIDEWRAAHKMVSVQAMSAALAVQGAWAQIPPDMKSSIPPQVVTYLTLGLIVLGIVGRFIKQEKVSGPDAGAEDRNEVHP